MLNDVLDLIWKSGSEPTVLTQAVDMMSDSQVLEAAMIHVAALIGLEPTRVSGNKMTFGAISAEVVRSSNGKGDVEYSDQGIGFVVQGVRIDQNDGPPTLALLLELFQYARDRSDTFLHLSPAEREARISAAAKRYHASERFVQIMLSRFRSLQSEIAA